MKISVVVPCFKSEIFLANTISNLYSYLSEENEILKDFEIILVVDGSPDNTLKIAHELKRQLNKVSVIELSRNYGQQASTLAGIYNSKFEYIVTMDDDGQHTPTSILELCKAMDQETDLIYGLSNKSEHGIIKKISSKITKFVLSKSLGVAELQSISALRIFRTSLIQEYNLKDGNCGNIDVLLYWQTNRIKKLEVKMKKRQSGKSNYTFGKIVDFGISTLVTYSTKPLRIAGKLGFLMMFLNLIVGASILAAQFTDYIKVPGYTSTILFIGAISSVQLLLIGVLGEYIGRIYEITNGRPKYSIKSKLS